MFHFVVFFITSRYMYSKTNNKFCSLLYWLYIIGIMLSVMSLIVITSIMNGFEYKLKNNILNYIPHVILTTFQGNLNPIDYPIKNISYLKDISIILPIVKSEVILQSQYNITIATMIGITKDSADPLLNFLCKINSSILTSNSYRVILGIKLAEKLKIKLGDQLRIIVPSVNYTTIIGKIPSQRLFTVVGFFNTKNEADDNKLLINQNDAIHLMRYPAGNITGWRLFLKHPFTVDLLSKQKLPKGLLWQDWREEKGDFFKAVRMEKNMIHLLLNFIAIVASFNIIGSLSLLVIEKRTEIAILQTLGLKKKQFFIIFMIHGMIIGIVGTIIGILIGLFIVNNINIIFPMLGLLDKNIELPVLVNKNSIFLISLFSIFFSLISTILPAWKSVILKPIEILRHE